MESFFRAGLGQAARFVSDRAELCALLSSRHDVRRGDLFARLPVANYPARLVLALVLARDIGSVELESASVGLRHPVLRAMGGEGPSATMAV